LIYALIWSHVTRTFNIVHRRGTDRAHNYLALIEQRELNGHPIEIITLYLASLQRYSMLHPGGISLCHVCEDVRRHAGLFGSSLGWGIFKSCKKSLSRFSRARGSPN
jgi:hypothetical protein